MWEELHLVQLAALGYIWIFKHLKLKLPTSSLGYAKRIELKIIVLTRSCLESFASIPLFQWDLLLGIKNPYPPILRSAAQDHLVFPPVPTFTVLYKCLAVFGLCLGLVTNVITFELALYKTRMQWLDLSVIHSWRTQIYYASREDSRSRDVRIVFVIDF